MVIIGHNTSEIQKLSFSRGALFDMKTIVGLNILSMIIDPVIFGKIKL